MTQPEKTAKIWILDDHPVIAAVVGDILSDYHDDFVVEQYSSLDKALEALKNSKPDFMVVDLCFRDVSPQRIAESLQNEFKGIPCAVCSGLSLPQIDALDHLAGTPKILKEINFEAFSLSLRQSIRKSGVELKEKRLFALSVLTRRHCEVLDLILQSKTDAEIADELGLSQETIAGHVRAILKNTNCRSRFEAAHKYEILKRRTARNTLF